MTQEDCVNVFKELGFTELEARIYTYLVQHAPATGYGIAKAIGKSNATTYKVIETLQAKGAIWVDDGVSRQCRAVPIGELLSQMERRFQERRDRAAAAVSKLGTASEDDRIYQLFTPDQVYERARQLLREASDIVSMELFPLPLREMRDAVEETAQRGVSVSVRIYEPVPLEHVDLIISPPEFETLKNAPAQCISLFADGLRYLYALLSHDGDRVYQAVWSASPFLSWSYFTFVQSDFLLSKILPALKESASVEEVRQVYEKWKKYYRYTQYDYPGYRALFDRLKQARSQEVLQ
jgi:sugar-specific transcriptional regulator TrmB